MSTTSTKIKQSKEKVKEHLQKNKKEYVTGAICLTIGVTTTAAYFIGRQQALIEVQNIRFWSPGNNLNFIVAAFGDPGNVVRCLEDGSIYASQNKLADALGVSPATVHNHLKGVKGALKGKHYEVIGKAGHNLAA